MKIAFFGNTGNGPLMIARAMQGMGHDVLLIVNRKGLLYSPEIRFPEYREGYPDWIVDGSQFSEWDYISLNPRIAPILDTLSGYDALILNDTGPSLLPLFQKPAISLLTGSDLTYYGDFRIIDVRFGQNSKTHRTMLDKRLFTDFIQRQREGIRLSVAVHYMPSGIEPLGDAILSEIGIRDSHRFFQFVADLVRITPSPQPNNTRIRVFCPVRNTWKIPVELGRSGLDYKGSDIMIRGLGLFHRRTGLKLDIVLVRKGLHIAELKKIIVEETIADQVTWLDEMPLTAVWEEMARSDIILEQFGNSMIAMVGMDAMASARPVIGNLRPELLGDNIPICQARTPEEICAQLERLVFDPKERERVGRAGREYVEKHANIDDFAQKCLTLLDASIAQSGETVLSLHTNYSYCLQQRHSLFEEIILQEQQNEQKTNLLKLIALTDGKGLCVRRLPKAFQRQGNYGWSIALLDLESIADNEEHPARSSLLLYENDILLQPAHSLHEDILNYGTGCYSHWKDVLYFSTSDGSNPNTNGRSYRVMYVNLDFKQLGQLKNRIKRKLKRIKDSLYL